MGRIEQIAGGWVEWSYEDQWGDVTLTVPEGVGRVWVDACGRWQGKHYRSRKSFDGATASEAVAWVQAQDAAWRGR